MLVRVFLFFFVSFIPVYSKVGVVIVFFSSMNGVLVWVGDCVLSCFMSEV